MKIFLDLRDLSVTLDKKRRVERCCKVIKTDNRATNLRWATKTDNMNNPLTRKKISESKKGIPQPKGIDNKRSKIILQYTLDGKFIKEWHGSKEIARAFNGCNSFILKCCRGIYRQAYGYIWKFKEGD